MRKIIIKILFIAVVFGTFEIIGVSLSPIVENGLAMNQMYNTVESSMLVQVYSFMKNYSFILSVLLVLIVFRKELSKLYTSLKKKIKYEEEKKNEEN